MKHIKIRLLFLYLLFSLTVNSQSIYSGGNGDGSTKTSYTQSDNPVTEIYSGGNGDGASEKSKGDNSDDQSLPIILLSFDAELQNDRIILNWTTTMEINNGYFSVEKSKEALNFQEIGRIKSSGNSNTQVTYSYSDDNPIFPITYYRLKQVDVNGAHSYSGIISVVTGLKKESISIFPNPANERLVIQNGIITKGDFMILDTYGRNIEHKINIISQCDKNTILDISLLNSGVYIIVTGKNSITFIKN